MKIGRKLEAFGAFFGIYLLGHVLAIMIFPKDIFRHFMREMITASILSLLLLLFYSHLRQLNHFQKDWWQLKRLAWTYGIGFSTLFLTEFTVSLLPKTAIQNQQVLETIMQMSPWFLNALVVVVLAPIVEELIFRSLFFKFLLPNHQILALIISSILFSFVHGGYASLVEFIVYFLPGIALGVIYIKTKRVENTILWHGTSNLISLLIFYSAK